MFLKLSLRYLDEVKGNVIDAQKQCSLLFLFDDLWIFYLLVEERFLTKRNIVRR